MTSRLTSRIEAHLDETERLTNAITPLIERWCEFTKRLRAEHPGWWPHGSDRPGPYDAKDCTIDWDDTSPETLALIEEDLDGRDWHTIPMAYLDDPDAEEARLTAEWTEKYQAQAEARRQREIQEKNAKILRLQQELARLGVTP